MVLRGIRSQKQKAVLKRSGNLQVSDHAGGNTGGGASNGGNLGVTMAMLIANGGAHVGATLKSTEKRADQAEAGEDLSNLHYETANVCQCRVNEDQRACAKA